MITRGRAPLHNGLSDCRGLQFAILTEQNAVKKLNKGIW